MTPVLDSHVHVWDLDHGAYAWLGPQHGPLHRSFLPDEAVSTLADAGVPAMVLVQAEDSLRDTDYLLDVAARHASVVGVVGWLPLEEPERLATELAARSGSALCGVRQLVHDDPRDDVLDLPPVRRSLDLLAEAGLPLDVPDAWPRHLPGLPALADVAPDLTLVLDHLGKPPRGTDELDAWAASVRELTRRPHVVAKVSGLQRPGQPFTADALRPVWELALECFGPDRLMYGGDWPMTVPAGGYAAHWDVVRGLVGELGADEQCAVLSGTASRVYRTEPPDDF